MPRIKDPVKAWLNKKPRPRPKADHPWNQEAKSRVRLKRLKQGLNV